MGLLVRRTFLDRSSGITAIMVALVSLFAATGTTVVLRLDDRDARLAAGGGASYPDRLGDARFAPRPQIAPKPRPVHRHEVARQPSPRATHQAPPRPKHKAKPHRHVDVLASARGLSAWIDLYDYGRNGPAAAAALVDRAAAQHVATIWIQTSRYNTPDIAYADALGAVLDRAKARGVKVIAWVLPEFSQPAADVHKAKAAAAYRSPGGQTFSALGLDIEVSSGAKPAARSVRMLRLAESLHHRIGMPLVGIVPPPAGFARNPKYWPAFPWQSLSVRVDALATMGYWSFSHANPGTYTATDLRQTRALVGRSSYPVHVIGGLAEDTSVAGVQAFCRAAKTNGALGASLYDLTSTPAKLWPTLQGCRGVGH